MYDPNQYHTFNEERHVFRAGPGALNEDLIREKIINQMVKQSLKFSWEKAAQETLAILTSKFS